MSDSEGYTFKVQKRVGGYYLGGKMGIGIMLEEKPIFIHRYFMKILLGWEWLDED